MSTDQAERFVDDEHDDERELLVEEFETEATPVEVGRDE